MKSLEFSTIRRLPRDDYRFSLRWMFVAITLVGLMLIPFGWHTAAYEEVQPGGVVLNLHRPMPAENFTIGLPQAATCGWMLHPHGGRRHKPTIQPGSVTTSRAAFMTHGHFMWNWPRPT